LKKVFFLLFLLSAIVGFSQFYNGLQMDFGKNRVQYNNFVWQYYRLPKVDVYFYQDGEQLAKEAVKIAEKKLPELAYFFQYELQQRIIVLVYNKLTDFRQSNIGLVSGNLQYNIGGVTQIIDNKIFIYYDGNRQHFEEEITKALAQIFINEMVYGTDFKTRLANSTLIAFPEWYLKGLVSYLSSEWNVDIDNHVRDGILDGRYEKFNSLVGDEATYAGHSIWYYIATKYGKSVIPNIVYLTKVSKNIDAGFMYVIGTSLKYLSYDWLNFYDEWYYKQEQTRTLPTDQFILKKSKKDAVYQHLTVNPVKTNQIAYLTNQSGKVKIWLQDINTGKKHKILRKGHKLAQITDYTNPVLCWHPQGSILTFTNEYHGKVWLNLYDLETKKMDTKELVGIQKVLDYDYSPDGFHIAMSIVLNGHRDIVFYSVVGNSFEPITKDAADDMDPHFIENGNKIIFSSSRNTNQVFADADSLINKFNVLDLYEYDIKTKKITRITNTSNSNERKPYGIGTNKFICLSDQNGINNFAIASYDSTIESIDTAIHYRYFTEIKQASNFSRNVEDYTLYKNTLTPIFFLNNRYHPTLMNIDDLSTHNTSLQNTAFREKWTKEQTKIDTININPKVNVIDTLKPPETVVIDTSNLDINDYAFTRNATDIQGHLPPLDTSGQSENNILQDEYDIKPRLYFISFYNNYIVNQIDFGFLNSSYQAFTGGAVYYNPGFNILFKIGTNDLFEDYKITGGFRFAGNFDSNEYLFSIENLKKRIDKQMIFHRQSFLNSTGYSLIKTHTHNLIYIMNYPFSQVSAVKMTTNLRYDRNTTLSTDFQPLNEEDLFKYWGGLKMEYIFDNTISLGTNLYNGTRSKVFSEFYNQLTEKKSDIFILGFDFRHYEKIHRSMIWASRIAGSTSFGHSLLMYYLGSVDNWINLSTRINTFDYSVPIDYSKNYVFQTLATNMRGFTQNIRNGNSFLLMNNEIRWPIVKYFANRPINSNFFENFQVIGFYDIGSAWSGKSPEDPANKYNTGIYVNGPVTVIINKDRAPYVMGYGFGVRSKILGYFVRFDWSWGIDGDVRLPKVLYLSLSLDF